MPSTQQPQLKKPCPPAITCSPMVVPSPCRKPATASSGGSAEELFLQHAFLEVGLVVEQHGHRNVAVFVDLDRRDVAHLGEVGDRTDRPLFRLKGVDADL